MIDNIKNIVSFLNDPTVFFEDLSDEGVFKKEVFHSYAKNIFDLSKMKLSNDDRYLAVITIWEISYKIQFLLSSHYSSDDYYSIKNLDDDDGRQISNILHYSANWFSYNKEIDEKSLIIGSWK